MYYSATIIEMAGIDDRSKAIWLSSLTGFVNFLFTFVGLIFVERLGRRKLILISLTGVALSLLFLSVSFLVARQTSPLITNKLSNSTCASLSSCTDCVMDSNCGFCFTKDYDHFKASCLIIDKRNSDFSKDGWCSNGFNFNKSSELKSRPIFSTDTCPNDYAYLIIFGLVFYLIVFASGLGCMPWVINSEIYPLNYRSGKFSFLIKNFNLKI